MARIFLTLSGLSFLLLVASNLVGFWVGDYGQTAKEYSEIRERLAPLERSGDDLGPDHLESQRDAATLGQRLGEIQGRFLIHFWLGIAAVLMTVLVNSVSVTYFIGTNRWCREVVEMYRFDESMLHTSQRLKGRTFPWSLGAIVVTLLIAATGGAADPRGYGAEFWVLPHTLLSLAGTLFVGWAMWVQVQRIAANYAVIEEILAAVGQRRAQNKAANERDEPQEAGQGRGAGT